MTQDLPLSDDGSPLTEEPRHEHSPVAVDTLKRAMRRARVDNAERAGVISDLRGAHLVRLELLHEELQPLVAQIPPDVDMFDIAIMPGEIPRLFIDMIGFVEMKRDAKIYRLLQDTRHGRIKIAESESIDTMVDAVTDYVARRLLERDKALAADAARRSQPAARGETGRKRPLAAAFRDRRSPTSDRPDVGTRRWLSIAFAFLIDLLGSIAFFSILAAIAWYFWNRLHTPI